MLSELLPDQYWRFSVVRKKKKNKTKKQVAKGDVRSTGKITMKSGCMLSFAAQRNISGYGHRIAFLIPLPPFLFSPLPPSY